MIFQIRSIVGDIIKAHPALFHAFSCRKQDPLVSQFRFRLYFSIFLCFQSNQLTKYLQIDQWLATGDSKTFSH